MSGFRITITDKGVPETATLYCAHCKLPHPVTQEMRDRHCAKAKDFGVTEFEVWECGKCWLAHLEHLSGLPSPKLRVECTHDVPPFPEEDEEEP